MRFLRAAPGVKEAQITTLDRPDHVSKVQGAASVENFETRFGFGANYFPELLKGALRPDLDLRLDNYWASTGAGVGDRTACVEDVSVYNHSSLIDPGHGGDRYFPAESLVGIFDNDHSGVHQWYRWSMDANGISSGVVCTEHGFEAPSGIGDSLDPCERGWNVALANPGAGELADNCDLLLTISREPVAGCVNNAGSTPCRKGAGEALSLTAGDEPAVKAASATVEIPVYARSVLFELTNSKPVVGAAGAACAELRPLLRVLFAHPPRQAAARSGGGELAAALVRHLARRPALGGLGSRRASPTGFRRSSRTA